MYVTIKTITDGKELESKPCFIHDYGMSRLNDKVSFFFDCWGYCLACHNCPFSSDGHCGCRKSTIKAKVKYLKDHPDFLMFCIDNHKDIWEEIKGLFYGARMT